MSDSIKVGKEKPGKSRAIIVLGMHRSGTSALARTLNLCGVDLGSNLMPPGPEDNVKGFWEHLDIFQANEKLLHGLNSSWDDVRALPDRWWTSDFAEAYKLEIISILERDFSNSPFWGVKDPRICHFLPLWRPILEQTDNKPFFLIIVRNPLEVVASLAKRDGFSKGKSCLLWLKHLIESEKGTRNSSRVFVTYDELLSDWNGLLTRVEKTFGFKWPKNQVKANSEIKSFLQDSLRHNRVTDTTLTKDKTLSKWIRDLYQATNGIVDGDDTRLFKTVNTIEAKLKEAVSLYEPALTEIWEKYNASNTMLQERSQQLDDINNQIEGFSQDRGYHLSSIDHLQAGIKERDERIERLDSDVADLRKNHSSLQGTVLEREAKISYLEAGIKERGERIQHLDSEVLRIHGELSTAQKNVAGLEAQVTHLQAGISEKDDDIQQTDAELTGLRDKFAASQQAVKERESKVDQLQAEIKERAEHAQRLESDSVVMQEQYTTLQGTIVEREAAVTHLQGRIKEKDDAVKEFSAQLARLNEEKERLMTEVAELRQSTSWKLTVPIRWFSFCVRSIAKKIRSFAVNIVRIFYHLLPFSEHRKNLFKSWFYSKIPFLFCHTLSYRLWSVPRQEVLPQYEILWDVPTVRKYDHTFVDSSNPTVSIIIPVYGEIEYTQRCILSISNIDSQISYEIIVVDDCSPDDNGDVLERIDGIRVVHNDRNLGFIRSCNRGSELALGEYLLFLSNKTKVMPGWLDELVGTFYQKPNAGLVGSKLISTDGSLQEAGGIIWRDGSNWNYGRKDNPDRPKYNYLRDVDYCSAVSIMVPRKLFHDKGCFTDGYGQTYYAAAELAFTIRAAGYRVLYQPLSQVIHYEEINTATDFNADGKACKVENEKKFREKWIDVLNTHRPNGVGPEYEKERSVAKRILIINDLTPTPDKDSGSVDLDSYLRIFLSFGYKITFIPAADFLYLEDYSRDLQRIGVECLYKPFNTNVTFHLQERGEEYDVVMLYRAQYASQFIDKVKKYCKAASVIFNTVDLHYLRMERQAVVENSEVLKEEAARIKVIELGLMDKADKTIILSNAELDLLKSEGVDCGKIAVVPLIREIIGRKSGYEGRNGIVFVGGFKHAPNVDAMHYFADEIWPLIKERIPEAEMYICGSHMPEEIRELDGNGIHTVGFVKDLTEYFNSCKLSIAPLRYGSGLKGKVGASLSYGLPCVATSIAIEGSGLIDVEHVLVEDTPIKFTEAVIRLYKDEVLWSSLSEAGLQFVTDMYSFDAGKRRIATMLSSLSS